MDLIDLIAISVFIGTILTVALALFFIFFGDTIDCWFRVMARRDLPSWDTRLRHLERHRFTWNGVCQTCRQAGVRDAEMASSGGRTQSQLWGSGYEAGYSDGQGNRPRRGDDSIS